jgi:predicted unusual protein kinase regulating ubiquinone biosynthesis (AarF/ABC1/UbiB family)
MPIIIDSIYLMKNILYLMKDILYLMKNILYFIKNIVFLVHVLGIVLYEYIVDVDFIDNVLHKLSKKNILYIKLFQACALNNTIVDNALNHKLITFCDNAPWSLNDIDIDTLQQLEEKHHIHISAKHQPINAGMISLVYKANLLKDGIATPIIVKIKRKNIEQRLHDAIEHALFVLMLVDWVPFLNTYDLPAVIRKNINLLTQQVNFETEVKHMQKFQTYCQRLNYIKIPQVYPAVTNQLPNVILMEYVEGKTIQHIEKADREMYAKLLMKFVYLTTFLYGSYHGDLHLGNILFLKDPTTDNSNGCKLCILDFGIVYEMEHAKDAVFDILSNIVTAPPVDIAEKILQSGLIEPLAAIRSLDPTHYATLNAHLSQFINQSVHIEKKLNHHQVFIFLSELNAYINGIKSISNGKDLRLRISDDLMKIQVFFAMNHGVILTLCEGINYIALSDQVMKETFHLDLFT